MITIENPRRVYFEDQFAIPFRGNVYGRALCTGDIDNDGQHEFVVGTLSGDLHIFKGGDPQPWKTCVGLGNITCLAIGALRRPDKNALVVLTARGTCYLFDETSCAGDEPLRPRDILTGLPPNVATLLIADVDGDGCNELVLARTDRELHVFRVAAGAGGRLHLQQERRLSLPDQLSSLSLSRDAAGLPVLVVGQPGGVFLAITKGAVVREYPVSFDPAFPTEIVGDIRRVGEAGTGLGLASSDGTVAGLRNGKCLWQINVQRKVIALLKADLTGDGNDELVACTWDGLTFIIDHEGNVVTFQVEESISAFYVGQYTCGGKTSPCLFYVTFSEHILVFRDAMLQSMDTWDLHRGVAVLPQLPRTDWARLASLCLYTAPAQWARMEEALAAEVGADSLP